MQSENKRLTAIIVLALLLVVLVAGAAEAGPPHQTAGAEQDECQDCHSVIHTAWARSGHGQAGADPAFREAWQEQGSPPECLQCHTTGYDPATGAFVVEGIACENCHSPLPDEHPEQIMPTQVSSDFCGACHLDTYAEWQTSGHGAEDMTCVKCHNPHTNKLLTTGVQVVCQDCHSDETHAFSATTHADEGVLCTDCHLKIGDSPAGEGHGQRQHTFAVDLDTCDSCHNEELHVQGQDSPSPPAADTNLLPASLQTNRPPTAETPGPPEATTLTVAILLVVGLLFGLAVGPWVEQRLHKGNW
ncbi:MAG: cytochrome c3 family protein [Chloroflexota bacterium]